MTDVPPEPSSQQAAASVTPPAAVPPAPQGPPPGYPAAGWYGPAPMSPADERTWATLAHLAPFAGAFVGLPVLGALVVFLTYKDRSPFVRRHAAAALNFQLLLLVVGVVGAVLAFLLVLVTLGLGLFVLIPCALALAVAPIVLQILAAVAAHSGQEWRYPLTPTFVH